MFWVHVPWCQQNPLRNHVPRFIWKGSQHANNESQQLPLHSGGTSREVGFRLTYAPAFGRSGTKELTVHLVENIISQLIKRFFLCVWRFKMIVKICQTYIKALFIQIIWQIVWIFWMLNLWNGKVFEHLKQRVLARGTGDPQLTTSKPTKFVYTRTANICRVFFFAQILGVFKKWHTTNFWNKTCPTDRKGANLLHFHGWPTFALFLLATVDTCFSVGTHHHSPWSHPWQGHQTFSVCNPTLGLWTCQSLSKCAVLGSTRTPKWMGCESDTFFVVHGFKPQRTLSWEIPK